MYSTTPGNSAYEEVLKFVQSRNYNHDEVKSLAQTLKEQYKTYDDDYLKAVLFPEESEPSRIPTKFPLPSALATQTWSFYLNTGKQGKGYVALMPQDLAFSCVYSPDDENWDGNPLNLGNDGHKYNPECFSYPIIENYGSARVVGASMRVQYIGEVQQESGIMVGSHVFDATIGMISEDIVENGYYITRGRPHEGMRLSYLPRDESDTEYCDLNYKIRFTGTNSNYAVDPNKAYNNAPTDLAVDIWNPTNQDFSPEVDSATNKFKRPDQFIGQLAKRGVSNTPYQMVVYWVGMPKDEAWIRVDVTRHLECVPRMKLRDIIAVKKCTPNQETVDVVAKLADVDARPLSNTLQAHEGALQAHANYPLTGAAPAHTQREARKGASGSWISKLMSGLWSAGASVASRFGPVG